MSCLGSWADVEREGDRRSCSVGRGGGQMGSGRWAAAKRGCVAWPEVQQGGQAEKIVAGGGSEESSE